MIHLNIRNVPRHLSEFKTFLDSLVVTFTVIALTETWFNDCTVGVNTIQRYNHVNMYRKERS